MVNKKGYLRILEAMIASFLLFGVVLFLYSQASAPSVEYPFSVQESQRFILNILSFNITLRNCIVNSTFTGNCFTHSTLSCKNFLNQTITPSIPVGYSAACEICNSSLSCLSSTAPLDTSVFTHTLFLVDGTNEKVLRLYFWR